MGRNPEPRGPSPSRPNSLTTYALGKLKLGTIGA